MLQALYQSSEKRRGTSDGIDAIIYSQRSADGAKFDEWLRFSQPESRAACHSPFSVTIFYYLEGSMLRIRAARADDIPVILELIRELAEYERAPREAIAEPQDLLRDGFSAHPKFRVVIAEWAGAPAGFALFFHNYSTWRGRPGLYLEDLFVRPQYRGKGIGKALLTHLARIAMQEGCARFEWQVLRWNTPALEFYRSLGAEEMNEWLTMRVSGRTLEKLAESGGQ